MCHVIKVSGQLYEGDTTPIPTQIQRKVRHRDAKELAVSQPAGEWRNSNFRPDNCTPGCLAAAWYQQLASCFFLKTYTLK